jgi:drug/metabolite transporter (DMT)-like permease
MLVVGLAVTFVGYSVAYYGVTQIQSGNWGLLDLMIPNRWTPEVAATKKDGAQ